MPTPYQPAYQGGHGYSEIRIEETRYQIRVTGNRATPRAALWRHLLYRAAEVTLDSGHAWFRVVDRWPAPERVLGRGDGPGGAAGSRRLGRGERDGARGEGLSRAGAAARRPTARPERRAPRARPHRRPGRAHRVYRGHRVYAYPAYPWPSWYWGWGWGVYAWGPPEPWPAYPMAALPNEAWAEILVFEGRKPPGDPEAYDAAAVIARLGPTLIPPG